MAAGALMQSWCRAPTGLALAGRADAGRHQARRNKETRGISKKHGRAALLVAAGDAMWLREARASAGQQLECGEGRVVQQAFSG